MTVKHSLRLLIINYCFIRKHIIIFSFSTKLSPIIEIRALFAIEFISCRHVWFTINNQYSSYFNFPILFSCAHPICSTDYAHGMSMHSLSLCQSLPQRCMLSCFFILVNLQLRIQVDNGCAQKTRMHLQNAFTRLFIIPHFFFFPYFIHTAHIYHLIFFFFKFFSKLLCDKKMNESLI